MIHLRRLNSFDGSFWLKTACAVCLFFGGVSLASAQTALSDFFPNLGKYEETRSDISQSFSRHGEFISNVSTLTPDPYQDVTISIQNPYLDLSTLYFTWLVNGQIKSNGLGKSSFVFRNGGVGDYTTVSLSVYSVANDVEYAGSWSFGAGEVSLVAESLGYVPPFYKGKNLYAWQGQALLRAIPNLVNPKTGKKYPSSQIKFTWSSDQGTFLTESGVGKDTFVFGHQAYANMFEEESYVSVAIQSLDGMAAASAYIYLEPNEVEALIYEEDLTLGLLFNKAVSKDYTLKEDQTVASFRVMPYYFSNTNSNIVKYTWYQNYQPIDNNNSRSLKLTLNSRSSASTRGSSFIDIDIENQNLILQNIIDRRPSFTINF